MPTIDEYLKHVTPSQQDMLKRIRKIIKQIVPEAEESISYGIPTFKYKQQRLIYFAAFKDHMSIFPASDEMIAEIGENLGKWRTSTGTLQFTTSNPIPEPIIMKIVKHRLNSIH